MRVVDALLQENRKIVSQAMAILGHKRARKLSKKRRCEIAAMGGRAGKGSRKRRKKS